MPFVVFARAYRSFAARRIWPAESMLSQQSEDQVGLGMATVEGLIFGAVDGALSAEDGS